MQSFTDKKQTKWDVELDIGAFERIADIAKVDLLEPCEGDDQAGSRVMSDRRLFATVLYAICKPQADEMAPQLTRQTFVDRLNGPATATAFAAFCQEIEDFFRDTGRMDLVAFFQKQQEVLVKAADLAKVKAEALPIDRMLEIEGQKIDRKIQDLTLESGNPSGNTPASLESIPAG
jgi:hypothetical protein